MVNCLLLLSAWTIARITENCFRIRSVPLHRNGLKRALLALNLSSISLIRTRYRSLDPSFPRIYNLITIILHFYIVFLYLLCHPNRTHVLLGCMMSNTALHLDPCGQHNPQASYRPRSPRNTEYHKLVAKESRSASSCSLTL